MRLQRCPFGCRYLAHLWNEDRYLYVGEIMPELPEVEMARRYLEGAALHQTIETAEVRDERILFKVSARIWRKPWPASSFSRPEGMAKGSFWSA